MQSFILLPGDHRMRVADTHVRARVGTDTKARGTSALGATERSTSDEHRLPFEVKAPNATTKQAIAELEAGKGKKFASVNDLMTDLHADN